MRQLSNYGDGRNARICVHCGRQPSTRDHMPSRVFLDEPYPVNLPVSPSCLDCNNNLSLDEEYVATAIECALIGDVIPTDAMREKIRRIIQTNSNLAIRIRDGRRESASGPVFDVEIERVRRILVKLARGHAAFEYNEKQLDEPAYVNIKPLHLMTPEEKDYFESSGAEMQAWPEVGSRAMQRLLIVDDAVTDEGWIEVQEDRYRYHVSQQNGLTVKIVIREYIAAEIAWE